MKMHPGVPRWSVHRGNNVWGGVGTERDGTGPPREMRLSTSVLVCLVLPLVFKVQISGARNIETGREKYM